MSGKATTIQETPVKRHIVGLTSSRTRLTNGGRQSQDFYRTPPIATRVLLEKERFPGRIWGPACGDGAMVKVLRESGYNVFATDLYDYGFGDTCSLDFLEVSDLGDCESIITNPPFKLADEFALHALSLPGLRKLVLFQRTAWMEGMARYKKLWSLHPPTRVWILSFRVTLWRGNDPGVKETGGCMSTSWYVWDLDNPLPGPPQIGWIAEKPGRLA